MPAQISVGAAELVASRWNRCFKSRTMWLQSIEPVGRPTDRAGEPDIEKESDQIGGFRHALDLDE